MTSTHTKLPWQWKPGSGDIFGQEWDGHGIVVANVSPDGLLYHEDGDKASEEAGANAELIVRAVNCHDDLLAACKEMVSIDPHASDEDFTALHTRIHAAISQADAVIGEREEQP